MDRRELTVRPLTPDLWPALEDLFGPLGACKGCWCMYWRIGPAYRQQANARNKAAFRRIVESGPPPGLLAFHRALAVGWCQLTPRDALPWLDRPWRLRRVDGLPVWTISCFYNTARGAKDERLGSLQSLDNQFAELGVRVEIVNHRKATGRAYVARFSREFEAWHKSARAFATMKEEKEDEAASAREALNRRLPALTGSVEWKNAPVDKRRELLEAAIRESVATPLVSDATMKEVQTAWLAALNADERLQNAVANAPVLTAEYSFQRPDVTTAAIGTIVPAGVRPPSLHTGRLIYAQGVTDRRLDFTANLSVSLFSEDRPGMRGCFRDLRTGVEAKFKLRDLASYGAMTLSFAGLYTFLNQQPLGLGIVAFNDAEIKERGHIGLFQLKFELPTANNTIRIPLSLTASNRTELIKEAEVRGQIGISFNLDALFLDNKPKP